MPAIMIAGMASCSDDSGLVIPDDPNGEEAGYITISISNSNLSTRAEYDEPGVENLNENLINSVTLCLSPSAGDRTDSDLPAFMQTFTGLDAKGGSVTLRIPLSMELEARLFNENSSNSCNVFAAVNVNPGEAKTVAELRDLAVTSTFATEQKQGSFTMDGDATVSFSPANHSASSEIKVKRSAAKFTLALAVENEIKETTASGEITWKPNLAGMFVMMQQGVWQSTLDPMPEPNMDADVYFNSDNKLNGKYEFEFDPNAKTPNETGMKYKYDYVQNIPFYSYPNKWTGNDDERHGSYMLLVVPWSADEGKSYRTCYYHVPVVPSGTYETVRNISYHINLHVGVLGSYVPEEPFEMEADYYVADWGSEDIDVDIKDYRYLVVDQNEFTVNNENTYSIPFYTSHPTKVISCTMTYYRYNFSDQGSEFAVIVDENLNDHKDYTEGEKVYDVYFDNNTKTLNITHDLVIYTPYNASGDEVLLTRRADGTRADIDNEGEINAMLNTIKYYKKKTPEEAEYSAIKFVIKVQHTDVSEGLTSYDKNKDYIEEVTIWQYPGMYITAVQNYCDNLESKTETNATSGNTFVNGNTNGNSYYWTNGGYGTNEPQPDPTNKDSNFKLNGGTYNNQGRFRRIFNYQNWDRSIGLGFPPTYFNWNPNLYLVTITQLSEKLGEKYIIDDPRSYNINNDLSNDNGDYTVDKGTTNVFKDEYFYFNATNYSLPHFTNDPIIPQPNGTTLITLKGFIKAPALGETEERTLKYYYPTREAKDNMYTIAPKFRICSSYAGTNGFLTREMSRRRAAAYQELGYPAGRWRLPTFGEVEYIMTLAAEEKIPRLFGTQKYGTWYYWCAQGAVAVPDAISSNQTIEIVSNLNQGGYPFYNMPLNPFSGDQYLARTRFVYDEWYWGSGTLSPKPDSEPSETELQYTFTWGDQLKTNPEN